MSSIGTRSPLAVILPLPMMTHLEMLAHVSEALAVGPMLSPLFEEPIDDVNDIDAEQETDMRNLRAFRAGSLSATALILFRNWAVAPLSR